MAIKRTLVVAAASRHGSTTEIAARLIATLTRELRDSWTVREGDLADLDTFVGADAVVLGSGVYLGRWLQPALKALEHVRGRPTLGLWMFSSGPASAEVGENDRLIAADTLVECGDAVDHAVFAGRLDTSKLSRLERLPIKVVHATSGDWRDWPAIESWALSIAAQLNLTDSAAALVT